MARLDSTAVNWRFSVAPMMGWTDRHERYFLRQLSTQAVLYTEMVAAGAVVHGNRDRFLAYHPAEHPVALQLGDSDVGRMTEAARLGAEAGFDEININIGCPSERGTHRLFGAHLMKHPELVAQVYEAMNEAVQVPVTIKTRIGVDREESYQAFYDFVARQADAGCTVFHIHARKAWLDGLSPKENRNIPPLRYEFVYRLKQERPELTITINGGIKTIEECLDHLQHVDGVMMGREAYHNPFLLARVDSEIFGVSSTVPTTRQQFLERVEPYMAQELEKGTPLHAMVKHLLGLFQGEPGARTWRRVLSQRACKPGAGLEVVHEARDQMLETKRRVLTGS